jgi:HPt (histidine-containing phosphotransfer) domain-containing protein
MVSALLPFYKSLKPDIHKREFFRHQKLTGYLSAQLCNYSGVINNLRRAINPDIIKTTAANTKARLQFTLNLRNMNQSLPFLPAFNAARVEKYFCNDFEAIKEMFKVTNDNLDNDLDMLFTAIHENDITGVQNVAHTILPIFNIIGLPAAERAVIHFHDVCMKTASTESLKEAFSSLWPQLENARELINEQCALFEMQAAL